MTILGFDRCLLDTDRRELRLDGALVDLQPLVFELIEYFAKNPSRAIGREELLRELWRTPYLSDSVLARAVMKARRAIGDDGKSPRLLVTLPRAGYRLDAQVSRREPTPTGSLAPAPLVLTAQPLDLALLPFDDDAGALLFEQAQAVLALMHLELTDAATLTLVPVGDVLALWPTLRALSGDTAALSRALGVRRVLSCNWRYGPQGFALELQLAGPGHATQTWQLQGTDAASLALQGARAVCGRPLLLSDAWPDDAGPARAARALALELAGQQALALPLFESARACGVKSASLDMAEARVQLWLARPQQARATLDRWWQAYGPSLGPVQRARALLLTGRCAFGLQDHESLVQACTEALALAQSHEVAQPLIPEILCNIAVSLVRHGEMADAIHFAERAALAAVSLGQAASEVFARTRLAQVLMFARQLDRAERINEQALQQARQSGLPRLLGASLLRHALLQLMLRKYTAAAAASAEAAQILGRLGDVPGELSAYEIRLQALLESGRLDEAVELEQQSQVAERGDVYTQTAISGFHALLDCRLGLREQGMVALERLTARGPAGPTLAQRAFDLDLLRALVDLGKLDRAREVAARMADDPEEARPLLAQALLSLVQGQRTACKDLLRQVWNVPHHRHEEAVDAAIDLAWLLLEEAAPRQIEGELEHLMAHVWDFSMEYLPARLLVSAYLLRQSPSAAARQRWDQDVAAAAPLRARLAWMLSADYAEALASGQVPLAPTLFTRVCW